MEIIRHEILDLASLHRVLLAGPDADTPIDGKHRVVISLRERAGALCEKLDANAE
jgi:hypothetical protein